MGKGRTDLTFGGDTARDWLAIADRLAEWIAGHVRSAGLRGTILGLSGGVDSAVAAALCRRAVGDDALAILMPCHSAPEDFTDAELVARTLGIATMSVDLTDAYDALTAALDSAAKGHGDALSPGHQRLAEANIKPRLRMITLYHYANRTGRLVIGTGNRAEIHVGYSTKYGDAGADLLPLANLLKREVRALGRAVGLPDRIIDRVPSAGLWPGQTDESEMGLSYHDLDTYLATGDATPEVRRRVDRMHQISEHKRHMPPVPPVFQLPPAE